VNVRLPPDDRTSRAIIRDTALRLFANQGAEGVTVRQIAAAARVSPALVIRHFGSKEGLREEVDAHVVRTIEAILKVLAEKRSSTPDDLQSVMEAVVTHLPSDSPIPRFIGRLLLDHSRAGRVLFRRLFEIGQAAVKELVKAGLAAPGADPQVRAAFLMANDLAVLLLREHLTELLGVDPLSAAGIKRWAGEVLAIYSSGLRPGTAVRVQKTGKSPRLKRLPTEKAIRGGKH
jgi:AcrR family transcriptional regulator